MTAETDLLPCPCGAPAKIYPTGTVTGPKEKLVASCEDPECQWSMIGYGPEQVAERWNRNRATEALRAERDLFRAETIALAKDAERLAEALREAYGQVRELCDCYGHVYPEASFVRYEALLREQEEGK